MSADGAAAPTPRPTLRPRPLVRAAWIVIAVTALGFLLRVLRLNWQPLWWDEGYSVYFATEPLARMLWLTARDIHPPLYYALLHGWIALTGSAAPFYDRLLSVAFGTLALPLQFWLGWVLFRPRLRPAWLALVLLAISPIHLYYSQEVRMYGLALALSLAASIALWLLVARLRSRPVRSALVSWPALAYLLCAVALLYTLYYAALLLAAHALWAIIQLRQRPHSALALAGLFGLILVLYLPWLLYAVPQLIGYVGGKVQSDQDPPLGPLAYVERHLVAFTTGHVRPPGVPEPAVLAPATIAICLIILGLVLRATLRPAAEAGAARKRTVTAPVGAPPVPAHQPGAMAALWMWLLVPVAVGWLINLRLPFFPPGGERLLLLVLPHFILLLAYGIDRTWDIFWIGRLAAVALAVNAALGFYAFYTTPRYTADDYRPLLRQVVQQGTNEDVLLAIFPWQVGYWRAYAPQHDPSITGPAPLLLADGAVEWSPQVANEVDAALERGVLWFPEPLTFGSSLPHEIEQHLEQAAVNVENRWYEATRLTAWELAQPPATQPVGAQLGPLRLEAAGITPSSAAAANQPVTVQLAWQPQAAGDYNLSLRIQDRDGHVWSSREYEQSFPAGGQAVSTTVGLIVPVGLPPGGYEVAVSAQTVSTQTGDGQALTVAGSTRVDAVVGPLEVTQPETVQSPARLPMQAQLAQPAESEGLSILGYSGVSRDTVQMAGSELAATLFLANRSSDPPERSIYLSLLDPSGQGVAGYEGWPLAEYPTAAWPEGALAQAPVAFFVPGALTSGEYTLVTGFLDPATGTKSRPMEVTKLQVRQRLGVFDRPTPGQAFTPPPQLGTHVRLLGYDLAEQAGQTEVRLYWEVLQPLLPPHHIFVHVDAPNGETLAQQDGPPVVASGPAPSGSWQPGEFLTTVHRLAGPLPADAMLRVGLYDPETNVRLPVTVNGQGAGDNVVLK